MASTALYNFVTVIEKSVLAEKIGHIDDKSTLEKMDQAWMMVGGIVDEKESKEKINDFYSFKLNKTVNVVEDYECEYKEIKGSNYRNSIKDTVAEYSASFLNNRGGAIYYGITNERVVKGVILTLDDIDEVNRIIYSGIASIHPAISLDYFEINYHKVYDEIGQEVENLYIIELVVPISPNKGDIYICNGTELHVRVRGVKKKLIGTEIVSYIQKRLLDERFKEEAE